MTPGPDPDDYFMEAILKRNEVTGMGEAVTDQRVKDIRVHVFTDEYDTVKLQIYRHSSFGLDDIQNTISHLHLDAKSPGSEASGRIAGHGDVMSTESVACFNCNCDRHAPRGFTMSAASEVCHHCNKQGHFERNCPELINQEQGQAAEIPRNTPGKGWIWRRRWADVALTLQHDDAL